MTGLKTWLNAAPLAVLGVGLLVTLAGLVFQAEGSTAGMSATAVLAVLAGSLLWMPQPFSRTLLIALPGAVLAGTLVATIGSVPGSIADGVCAAVLAGAFMGILGITTSRWTASQQADFLVSNIVSKRQTTLVSAVAAPVITTKVTHGNIPAELSAGKTNPVMFSAPAAPALDVFFADDEEQNGCQDGQEEPDQYWSRMLADDEDRLEGVLLADLQPGQRHRYLHVPFIPFFQIQPTGHCDCECDGADEVDAELDQIHPYGARLSIRRRGNCAETARVRIHLCVTGIQRLPRAA